MRWLAFLLMVASSAGFFSAKDAAALESTLATDRGSAVVESRVAISVDPDELLSALGVAMQTDHRHVYPLLLLAHDGTNDGLYLEESKTQAVVPRDLTIEQASALISFAYDEDGAYRGWAEFNERLHSYLIDTGLHLKETAIIDVEFVPSGESSGSIRIVTSERRAACRFEGDQSFSDLLETNPVTAFTFTTIVQSPASIESLIGTR